MLDRNLADRFAVALCCADGDQLTLGYLPRYLARDFRKLIDSHGTGGMRIFVHRVNHDAPFQQRLLCRMNASWPVNFEPCSDEAFQPIPEGMLATNRVP